MKRTILIALLIVGSIGVSKPALSVSWNELNSLGKVYRQGYIEGVWDTAKKLIGEGSLLSFCMPDGITIGQIVAIAEKNINEHPEWWNNSVAGPIIVAWVNTWPCK